MHAIKAVQRVYGYDRWVNTPYLAQASACAY